MQDKATKLCTILKESGKVMIYEASLFPNYPKQIYGATAFHAKTLVFPAKEKDCKRVSVQNFFTKLSDCCKAAPKKINLNGCSQKMLKVCLALETDLISQGASLSWGGWV